MENLMIIFLNAILQILVMSLVPFVFYLFKKPKTNSFFHYVGLKKANKASLWISLLFSAVFILVFFVIFNLSNPFRAIISSSYSVSGELKSLGFNFIALLSVFIIAILKTALAEEIFFRGFVSKLIIKYLGFKFGIIIQAAVFSIIHLLLFLSVTDNILFLSYSLIFPFVFSIVAVYINERKADGSILPSFLMHGITNFATYLIVIYAL